MRNIYGYIYRVRLGGVREFRKGGRGAQLGGDKKGMGWGRWDGEEKRINI